MKLQKIGEVGIDSGHIVIVDPGMASLLIHFEDWFTDTEKWKQIDFPSAVSISTGGDGELGIYAIMNDEQYVIGWLMAWKEDLPHLRFEWKDENNAP